MAGVCVSMSNDRESPEAAHLRLLAQLEQVEREREQIDLHDTPALEACQRKIALLRAQIARHLRAAGQRRP
jgi:hypothetical protein